jgi:hypothetical protein
MGGLTSANRDSTFIKKMRAWDDGTLWTLSRDIEETGYIYVYTGLSWSKWTGLAIGGYTNPSHLDFDLASTRLWAVSKDDPRNSSYYAAVAGNGNNSTVASWLEDYYTGNYTGVRTYAESDSSAWFLESSTDPDRAAVYYSPINSQTRLRRMRTSAAVASGFSDSLPLYSSASGVLHQGCAAPGEALLPDGNGGMWIVMNDGVSHMKVSDTTTVVGISKRTSLASMAVGFRAGKLELMLPSAQEVHVQVLDLNGRLLERQDLGTLAAGSHVVNLSRGQGLLLVRVQAGEQSRTLRLPSF